jgi:hypothetical protein
VGRKVERWSKVPKVAAAGWYRESVTALGIGALLVIASEGEPIEVTADWRTDLCRLLMLRPADRNNAARAFDRLAKNGLLTLKDGYVTVHWSAASLQPVCTTSEPRLPAVCPTSAPSLLAVCEAKPLEIVKDTSPRQTDRQTEETAQHARANGFDHSLDQKRVLRAWHEVFATSEIPRSERLEQVTAACTRQATAEKGSLEAIARRTFERFKADPYTAQAKNRFALLASQVDNWVGPEPALPAAIPITRMQKLDAAYEADIRVRLTKLKKLFDERIALAADDPDRQARLAHEKKLEVWKLEAKLA